MKRSCLRPGGQQARWDSRVNQKAGSEIYHGLQGQNIFWAVFKVHRSWIWAQPFQLVKKPSERPPIDTETIFGSQKAIRQTMKYAFTDL